MPKAKGTPGFQDPNAKKAAVMTRKTWAQLTKPEASFSGKTKALAAIKKLGANEEKAALLCDAEGFKELERLLRIGYVQEDDDLSVAALQAAHPLMKHAPCRELFASFCDPGCFGSFLRADTVVRDRDGDPYALPALLALECLLVLTAEPFQKNCESLATDGSTLRLVMDMTTTCCEAVRAAAAGVLCNVAKYSVGQDAIMTVQTDAPVSLM